MKKILKIILCILISFSFCYYVFAKAPVTLKTSVGGAKVTELEDTTKALCEGQKDFRNLKVSDTLKTGCEVTTEIAAGWSFFFPIKVLSALTKIQSLN
ncbi:MAG: hypothetical protein ABSF79_00800 [Smithellaceae bacterium]|jgi:hypothetical protein